MTKKSIFREQFSWKVSIFATQLTIAPFLLLNFSAELRPRKRFYEQNQISIEAAHHSADFNHS